MQTGESGANGTRSKKTEKAGPTPLDPIDARSIQLIGGARIPPIYEVWRNGVYKLKQPQHRVETKEDPPQPDHTQKCPRFWRQNLELVIEQPMAVVGRGMVVDAEEALTELWFRANGSEHRKWVNRMDLATSKSILELASKGFVIDETNARKAIEYLRKCLVANETQLTEELFVKRYGYHNREGAQGWLVGDTWVGSGVSLRPDPRGGNPLREGFQQVGELDEWIDFVRPLLKDRQRRHLLGSAFGSVLIRHLAWRPHVVHHWGGTAAGKTQWAKLSMSAWGDPDILMRTLNSTTIGIDAIYRHIDDFALLFDEQQSATVNLSQVIYNFGSGQGRTRATKTGDLQDDRVQWKALLRTTGEQSITGVEQADLGGQDTRCVQINAGRATAVNAKDGSDIADFFLKRNWGTAGAAFLEQLYPVVSDPDRLTRLRKRFQHIQQFHICKQLTKQFPGVTDGQLVIRSGHLAVSALGQYLATTWLFGADPHSAYRQAVEDAVYVGIDSVNPSEFAPLAERVLGYLRDHYTAEGYRYIDLTDDDGWRELRKRGRQTPVLGMKLDAEVWYIPTQIDWVLRKHGWDPRRVWRDLADSGVLQAEGRHLTRFRQLTPAGISRQRLYVVSRAKLFPEHEAPPPKGVDVQVV